MSTKCLLVLNTFKEKSENLAQCIEAYLKSRDVDVERFCYDGVKSPDKAYGADFKGRDFVITLGGDGTVLFACRGCAPLGIPVFVYARRQIAPQEKVFSKSEKFVMCLLLLLALFAVYAMVHHIV